MSKILDTEKLSHMLKLKRGERGLRAVALEIGDVSAPTLSRIEQGRLPDVDTFIKICKWLEVSTDFFVKDDKSNALRSKENIVAHLRADKELSKDTIDMLLKMIDLAYSSK